MASEKYADHIDEWVEMALQSPKNLATETELREQAHTAVRHFLSADIDASGSLSFAELRALCEALGLPMSASEDDALAKMDTDGDGSLSLDEWAHWWLRRVSSLPNPARQQEVLARNTFDKMDVDGSGYLDISELRTLTETLGAQFSEDELAQALREIDSDESGVIDREEFVHWWTQRSLSLRDGSQHTTTLVSLKLKRLAARAAIVFHSDIFQASWQGETSLVRSFVESEARLVHAADESDYGGGWRALHYASYRGFVDICALLLEHKAAVNATNDCGFTALFYAAQQGHVAVCELLMENGADPSLFGAEKEREGESESDRLFLSPVDFVSEYPALREIFSSHTKVSAPKSPAAKDVSATLSAMGSLQLSLRFAQKTLSALPITKWRVSLSFSLFSDDYEQEEKEKDDGDDYLNNMVDSERSCECVIRAVHPQLSQSVSCAVPRSWLQALHRMRWRALFKRLRWRTATAEGILSLWAALRALYLSADETTQRRLSLEDALRRTLERSSEREGEGEDGAAIAIRRNFLDHLSPRANNEEKEKEKEKEQEKSASKKKKQGLSIEEIDEVVRSFAANTASKRSLSAATSSRQRNTKSDTTPAVNFAAAAAPVLAELEKEVNAALQVLLKISAVNGIATGEESEEITVDVRFPPISSPVTEASGGASVKAERK